MPNIWITDGLRRIGKKQAELAKHLGVSESVLSKMIHSRKFLRTNETAKIQEFITMNDHANVTRYASTSEDSGVRRPDVARTVQNRTEMTNDLPVYGTALGGTATGVEFIMNGDSGIRVRRPAKLEGREDVFALYVRGDSMDPKYPEGDFIVCEKKRPAQIGDYVVVELLPTADGTQIALLKKLVGRSGGKLKLQQYNPPKTLEIDMATVSQVCRVMTTHDLLG